MGILFKTKSIVSKVIKICKHVQYQNKHFYYHQLFMI